MKGLIYRLRNEDERKDVSNTLVNRMDTLTYPILFTLLTALFSCPMHLSCPSVLLCPPFLCTCRVGLYSRSSPFSKKTMSVLGNDRGVTVVGEDDCVELVESAEGEVDLLLFDMVSKKNFCKIDN